jgi:dynein heavy chain
VCRLAFKDLEASVNNMSATLPLVSELHAPAMRDRHWKVLSSVCRTKAINPKDPKFCLEDMLELKLHTHAVRGPPPRPPPP